MVDLAGVGEYPTAQVVQIGEAIPSFQFLDHDTGTTAGFAMNDHVFIAGNTIDLFEDGPHRDKLSGKIANFELIGFPYIDELKIFSIIAFLL